MGLKAMGWAWVRVKTGTRWRGRAKTGIGFKGCGHPTSESPVFGACPGFQTGHGESRPKGDPSQQVPTLCPSGIGTRPEVIT